MSKDDTSAGAVALVDRILTRAVQEGASDVHIARLCSTSCSARC